MQYFDGHAYAMMHAMADKTDAKPKWADLVLEGGGVKGIGLVGAIGVLEANGYKFKRIAGTSAGSIAGALVAAGYDSESLTSVMNSIDYTKFRDETMFTKFGAPGKLLSLLIENGLYKGNYVKKLVAELLEDKGVKTFGDLRLSPEEAKGLPKNQAYKLVVVTADISKGELVYLPWDYEKYGLDPDIQPVANAVRASISIPFFYKPAHIGRSTFVDGGVLSNFPVDIFDSTSDWPTFGVKLSSKEKALQVSHKVTGPFSLAGALLATLTAGNDQRHLDDPCTIARTIFVDTENLQSTDFGITPPEQHRLFVNGQDAATDFLKSWDFAKFKKICPPNK